MKRQQTTAEYLHSFLPLCFSASMDAMTEEALADALDDLAGARAREWCAEDCQLEVPQEPVVRNLAADIARRICRRAYDCWEDAEEELRLRVEDDIEECQEADRPDIPQGSKEDGSL